MRCSPDFRVGFGIAQNATITLMLSPVPGPGLRVRDVSAALWNVAYDPGKGIGTVGFGAVAA